MRVLAVLFPCLRIRAVWGVLHFAPLPLQGVLLPRLRVGAAWALVLLFVPDGPQVDAGQEAGGQRNRAAAAGGHGACTHEAAAQAWLHTLTRTVDIKDVEGYLIYLKTSA